MRVVVAMSGGVDSSVAAAMMVEAGHDVIGVMLRLWNQEGQESENRCCTPEAVNLARRVAARLGIPFHVLDAKVPFYQAVVEPFLDDYAAGLTPNPCIRCNRLIRWGFLMDQARAMGAEAFVTGHYARIEQTGGLAVLRKGLDPAKDQSYVLAGLTREQLGFTMLPVGDYRKDAIRARAANLQFEVASKPDSQDLCFLGNGDYRDFLAKYRPDSTGFLPGEIVDVTGRVLGQHEGLIHYTIGQRKGIRLAAAQPLYVIRKEHEHNRLVVGPIEVSGVAQFTVGELNWLGEACPPDSGKMTVMVRYRSREMLVRGLAEESGQGWLVTLEAPQTGIAPGQLAVFYQGDRVMGSGRIKRV